MTANRLIQPPPRSSLLGTVLICTAAILLSILSFSPSVNIWFAALGALLFAAALFVKDPPAISISLFLLTFALCPFLHPSLRNWPFNLLAPIILYLVVVLAVPRFRRSLQWLRAGRFGKDIVVLVIATSVVSGVALYLWYRLLRPDLGIHLAYLPEMRPWLFPLAGLGFAMGNAAMEEFVFRGLIMESLDSAFGAGPMSIAVQAWLFGALHFLKGFPNGWWGLAMTVVYGVLLGVIRRRSQGMVAPWLAHVCADLVIFAILAGIVLQA